MSVLLERAEAAAFRDSILAAPSELGFELLEVAGAVCGRVRSLPDERMLNRVVAPDPLSATELDRIVDWFGEDAWMVCAPPSAALDDDLRARGFTDGYAWMRFERPAELLEPLGDLDLLIDDGDAFARIVTVAFGMPQTMVPWLSALAGRPGWECWVARCPARVRPRPVLPQHLAHRLPRGLRAAELRGAYGLRRPELPH